jgi:glycerophosphoryl diester phosphodiesterase
MFSIILRILGGALAIILIAYVANASFWSSYRADPVLLAHRGMAQTYHREDLERDTCTATRIDEPDHPYLENTIASMRAAFAMGADIVELDIHPTTDGHFAVFHDWTLECRTEGKGVTHEQSMSYLKTLDVGYGYTADGGKTFPFRGMGVGLMPTLDEVLQTFPDRRFLINVKSRDPGEGERLATRLLQLTESQRALLSVYGGHEPVSVVQERIPGVIAMSKQTLKDCLLGYIATGWLGIAPDTCRNSIVLVPSNVAPVLWGWPNRFFERMQSINTQAYITGPVDASLKQSDSSGIDKPKQIRAIPQDFSGGIWTNRIDRVGAHFGRPHAH